MRVRQYRKHVIEYALRLMLQRLSNERLAEVVKLITGVTPKISEDGVMISFDFDKDNDPIAEVLFERKLNELGNE